VRFAKGHGTGNDFVVLPDPDGRLSLDAGTVRRLCDRRFGIGGDGVLRVVRCAAEPEAAEFVGQADYFMDYRNADGSRAEMCGNGARVFGRYLVDNGFTAAGEFAIATRGGLRALTVPTSGEVTVALGRPARYPGPAHVVLAGHALPATAVTIPNPHLVVEVADPAVVDLSAPLAHDASEIFPDGANIEVIRRDAADRITMRVHERGVGETLACGTGAAAAAWVATDGRPGECRVDLPGGSVVVITRPDGELLLRGAAEIVAVGEYVARP
jgi:diaminopimelate epimerase